MGTLSRSAGTASAEDNWDIYVKLIGPGSPQRLTTDPAMDFSPAWSPDGRSIAFVRVRGDRAVVIVVPSRGGPERECARDASKPEVSGSASCSRGRQTAASWSSEHRRRLRHRGVSRPSMWRRERRAGSRRRRPGVARDSAAVGFAGWKNAGVREAQRRADGGAVRAGAVGRVRAHRRAPTPRRPTGRSITRRGVECGRTRPDRVVGQHGQRRVVEDPAAEAPSSPNACRPPATNGGSPQSPCSRAGWRSRVRAGTRTSGG